MTVVNGYGQFSAKGSIAKDSYVAAARTADGNLVMAYMPFARTILVDMSRLTRAALGRWYDLTNGTYRQIDTATCQTPVSGNSRRPVRTVPAIATGCSC